MILLLIDHHFHHHHNVAAWRRHGATDTGLPMDKKVLGEWEWVKGGLGKTEGKEDS